MEVKKLYVLKFHQYDSNLYWIIDLTEKEKSVMEEEIDHYNKWIQLLYDGLAPLSSYENPEEANNLYLAHRMIHKNNSYNGLFERPGGRGYFEEHSESFSFYPAKYDGDNLLDEDGEEETGDDEVFLKELEKIIISPLSDEFGMGYRVLPMTSLLIGD